uniref:SCPlike extracellular protein putative n=1 Tax=Albugo laibachii Nc14 TaxID=890382 RepID=F0WI02_9STRA|nr:SCPlike extracellular protein putative [Albugo laibachii Nc14]|eukprot:CCA20879.1 SCPlike extracellular protein putative [Albugo laibachii Nc14]
MKSITHVYLLLVSSPRLSVNAQQFPELAKAYWIERLAFFRVNALLHAASDMKCVSWSNSLETQAGNLAHNCSKPITSQVNFILLEQHEDPVDYVDAAMKEWGVKNLMELSKKLPDPKENAGVGTGLYDSYSLLVWATTNQVGCGYGICGESAAVVCVYNGAPNTANRPWYTHGAQASACPSGTKNTGGLCTIGNQRCVTNIAKIPVEKLSNSYYKNVLQTIQAQSNGKEAPVNAPSPSTQTPKTVAPITPNASNPIAKKEVPNPSEKKEESSPPAKVEESPFSKSRQPNGSGQVDSEKKPEGIEPPVQSVQTQAAFTKTGGAISPVAITGLVAVGCLVLVVGAVLVRYKQSQKRQQEIVRDAALGAL